ncbi:MAG: ABC transporter ATP-binding protein/permease [Bacteroidetes bacterium]|nr:ABC transporter ATP-binding protein [Bacteroidota bacterium]MCZ2132436.1 ABC transporter ATP-binding protein/permease [Bacteroidota bacterium]
MKPTDEKLYKKIDWQMLRRLLGYLRPYRRYIAYALTLAVISSALMPVRPVIFRWAIDDFVVTGNKQGLLGAVMLVFGVLAVSALLQFGLSYLMQWVGQKVLLDIRISVFRHIQQFALKVFDTTPVGRLITRVTNDVEALNELFSSGVVLMISDILLVTWIVGYMFMENWKLALLTILALPLLLTATSIFRKKVRAVYSKIRHEVATMNSFLNEYLTGISTVQLFSLQRAKFNRFDAVNARHRDYQRRSVLYYAVFFPVVEIISALALTVILWYSARNIFSGEMTIGLIVAFAQFVEMFFRPIRDLTEKYNTLQSAMAASERIFALLDDNRRIEDKPNAVEFGGLTDSIEFRNVDFSYDGRKSVLKNVSFTVKKGQTVAIVGATGAGKTSIINLLCRFYEFQGGDILFDGQSIRDFNQDSLRSRIALVLQDVFLFSRSAHENITMGNSQVSEQDVKNAATAIGADDFIERLPEKYNTQIRERGSNLSVGQKQLISFARALAINPDILILDEATSSVDAETEQLIEESIARLLKGRSSIVIAHRLSTVQRADVIIAMHQGEIREIGSHSELLAANGLYAKLYRYQYGISRRTAA